MAVGNDPVKPGGSYGMEVETAITQYDVVKLGTGDGKVVKTSAANDGAIGGVHTDKGPTVGQGITVFYSGIIWVRAAAAITANDWLEATVDGEVQTETPANGVDQEICGRALAAAAGANELVPMLISLYKYNNETV